MTRSAPLSREALFARDGYRCVYCGLVFPADQLSVDHVEPRVRGGDHSGGNVVCACTGCNLRKGHRRLADFLAEEPESRRNFFRLARYIWPRHRRAVVEVLGKRGIGVDD
jgi:5-methylcytosine-specific restriction endonuclease McrA